ncbi:sensor histidine kinase [Kocuria massiliensis]|uniref:sensor histidine kinase n=1 Tax=Kocuria massiliensis TaxID=1926282 RepID=UPI000A1C84CC|nr:ATP-binding protein [Kocuria massiliensis]
MSRPSDSFSRRVLTSQLAVIIVVLTLAAGIFAWLGIRNVTDTTETQALAIARTLSTDDVVVQAATDASTQGIDPQSARQAPVQKLALKTGAANKVDFVVVTDDHGLRLAHPEPSLIGKKVSTSPDAALAGHEEITHQAGTLGETVRAKVPVYSATGDGTVVGEVSVGIKTSAVGADVRREVLAIGGLVAVALAVGVAASVALGRRLRRQTLGIGPEELAEMTQHQEAVLRGLDDGVLGFSPEGRLTLTNQTARRLLGQEGATEDVVVPHAIQGMVVDVLEQDVREGDEVSVRRRVAVADRILLATAVRVRREGMTVGGVVTLRDETQVLMMSRQLESVTTMADALRTQRHEFANRLHTVMGLVGTGAYAEAESYLGEILRTGPIGAPVQGIELVEDPYLRALIEAKGTTSAESGVDLRVAENSLILGRLREPEDVTLILGNLMDNAVRAVVRAEGASRVVEVQLMSDGADLHAVVTDSGAGIDSEAAGDQAFEKGMTGEDHEEDGHGLGIGLALCRRVAGRHGGRVWLLARHDERFGGASFGVELPDVLEEIP